MAPALHCDEIHAKFYDKSHGKKEREGDLLRILTF